VTRAVLLAVLAGMFTAMSSICQRRGAMQLPEDDRFNTGLILRLLRRPVWLMGVGSMIVGFLCQAVALHYGSLALVQPILCTELLFVFAYLAFASPRRVRAKDWAAALSLAAGLGVFLFSASPSGGRPNGVASSWFLAAVSGAGLIALLVLASAAPRRRGQRPAPGRRAALLGVATGVAWGFLAGVIKELSDHTGGFVGYFTSWPLYVLLGVGTASMILSSNALSAGPLPASQPGFTIVDPLIASLLGAYVFGEHFQSGAGDLAGQAVGGLLLLSGVIALSHSSLTHGEARPAVGPDVDTSRSDEAVSGGRDRVPTSGVPAERCPELP
jgi:drug/metabolite transporter (DMT)-like permease